MKFECSYCGKEYDTPIEMAECIVKCDKKKKEKTEQERITKLQKEKEMRLSDIQNDYKKLTLKMRQYNEDYNQTLSFIFNNSVPKSTMLKLFI